jgi:hypothetical protein
MSFKDILDWIAWLLAQTFKDAEKQGDGPSKRSHARDLAN